MIQRAAAVMLCPFLSTVLMAGVSRAQQPNAPAAPVTNCPSQPPGVYIKGGTEWSPLSATNPSRMKAKHAFLSSVTEGAVAAPMVVEYANPHAAVDVHTDQPTICVSHLMTSAPPMLIRLNVKKKIRELDSGSVRAIPFGDTSRQGHAVAGSIVPTTTEKPEYGIVLLQPQTKMDAGEYAVMFGADNLAVFDFGVDAPEPAQK